MGPTLLDEMLEREVGAIEKNMGGHVGDLDLLPEERHVDHAKRRDRSGRCNLDIFVQQHAVARAGTTSGREVDVAADAAPATDESPLAQPLQVCGRAGPRRPHVVEVDRQANT